MSDNSCSNFFECQIGPGINLWVLVACGIVLLCICCICVLIGFFLWRRHALNTAVNQQAAHNTVIQSNTNAVIDMKPPETIQHKNKNNIRNNTIKNNNIYQNNNNNNINNNINNRNNNNNANNNSGAQYNPGYNAINDEHGHIKHNIPSTDQSNNNITPNYKYTPNSKLTNSGISTGNDINYSSQQELMHKKYDNNINLQQNNNDNNNIVNNVPKKDKKRKNKGPQITVTSEDNKIISPNKNNKSIKKNKKSNKKKKRIKKSKKQRQQTGVKNDYDTDDSDKTKNTELSERPPLNIEGQGTDTSSEETESTTTDDSEDGIGTGGTTTGNTNTNNYAKYKRPSEINKEHLGGSNYDDTSDTDATGDQSEY